MDKLVDTLAQQGLIEISEVAATSAGESLQFATCRSEQDGDVQLFFICSTFTKPRRILTRLNGDLEGIVTAVTGLKVVVSGDSAVCLEFKAHKGQSVKGFLASIL